LGEQPSVWCECLFVDPIADIAVLGTPDDQALSDQAASYEAFVKAVTPLTIAEPPGEPIAEDVAHLADFARLNKFSSARVPGLSVVAKQSMVSVQSAVLPRWYAHGF